MTLFARSFLLIALLILASAAATFQLYRVYEREPRARELAQQTVSIVNLTRAALVNADPVLRRNLLIELNAREGIRLAPLTAGEVLEPLPDERLFELVIARVKTSLGTQTRFAYARDKVEGFWVSFAIDEDEYWVMLPRERFEPAFGLEWLGAGLGLLVLALVLAPFVLATGVATVGCTQHAERCFSPTGISGGSSSVHLSILYAHRGANEQPFGRFTRSGGTPSIGISRSFFPWSSRGTDFNRPIVYGCRGLA